MTTKNLIVQTIRANEHPGYTHFTFQVPVRVTVGAIHVIHVDLRMVP